MLLESTRGDAGWDLERGRSSLHHIAITMTRGGNDGTNRQSAGPGARRALQPVQRLA